MPSKFSITDMTAEAAMVHGVYVVMEASKIGNSAAAVVAEKLSNKRKVLLVCPNMQIVRQAVSRLRSNTDVEIGGLSRHVQVAVTTLHDSALIQPVEQGYDVLIIDEMHQDQIPRAAILARRFMDARKTVVNYRPLYQQTLLDDDNITVGLNEKGRAVIRPAGSDHASSVMDALRMEHSLEAMDFEHSNGDPEAETNAAILLAAQRELKSAKLLIDFGHRNASIVHSHQAMTLAAVAAMRHFGEQSFSLGDMVGRETQLFRTFVTQHGHMADETYELLERVEKSRHFVWTNPYRQTQISSDHAFEDADNFVSAVEVAITTSPSMKP